MWRFYLIATVIVVAIGGIVFGRRMAAPDLRVSQRVAGTPTPTVERRDHAAGPAPTATFAGAGAWTMSSLPACFRERAFTRGPLAKLRAKIPRDEDRVKPATVVRAGDCTVVVGEHDLWIYRRGDRLYVPPEARLYRRGERLTLVAIARDRAEIREY